MAVVYLILLVVLAITSAISLKNSFSVPALVADLALALGLGAAFLEAASKKSLKIYFWLQRLRIWWYSDAVTKWSVGVRLNGNYNQETLHQLLEFLRDPQRFKFPVRVDFSKGREAQVEIDRTLTFRVTVDTDGVFSTDSNQGIGANVTLLSKTMEVSYGHAKKKIDAQIVPVLTSIRDHLKPESSSFELNVDFDNANPFFAVYIAHLRREQIGDFNVLLYLDDYSKLPQPERAEISRNCLHITSTSTDSLAQLARDFILLSPDLTILAGAKQDG